MSADQTGGIWLTELPPTRGHNRAVIIVVIAMVIGFAAVAPISGRPQVELNALFPSLDAIVFVTDLVTAALLFGQFHISRSRAVLALAVGYLFTALIVVPHALTFAGALTPSGLLGANIQTGSWLFIFWHLGFSAALLVYAMLRHQRQAANVLASTSAVVGWSVLFVAALVSALTWLATAGVSHLPPIILDRTRMSPIVIYPISFTILISAAALGVLAIRHRRSVLDQWLMVVSLAAILELVFSGLLPTVRFSAGFYAGRVFSLLTSSIVLIALVAETTRLYVRLARTNVMLQRERDSRLMNLEALTASIAHEIRQPLTAIVAFTQAALLYLKRNPPELQPAISTLDEVVETSHRTDQIFNNMRGLFGRAEVIKQPIDLNELLLGVLHNLEPDLVRHHVITRVELTSPLPPIYGNKGQLQEVLINLAHNAMEAMASATGQRLLKFETDSPSDKSVSVVVEDSGPGWGDLGTASIFEAFVTTKPLGMGLGLAICRQIIERHNGRISASQKSPHGAVFRIDLPAAQS
jgi:signal transduction histidine kinase